MYDVCDGHLMKTHAFFSKNKNGLQIILYYDEFTAVNPLSPTIRKNKLGMSFCYIGFVYFTYYYNYYIIYTCQSKSFCSMSLL